MHSSGDEGDAETKRHELLAEFNASRG